MPAPALWPADRDRRSLICPIQDARAGQVYGAAFLAGMPPVRMLPNMAEALPVYLDRALAVAGERRLCFLGDGVSTYRDAIVEGTSFL